MTRAGRFALLLLTAMGGVACHARSHILTARDGGSGGASGGTTGAGGISSQGRGGGSGVGGNPGVGGGTALPAGPWVDRTPCRIPFAWPPAIRDARAVFDSDRGRVVLMGTWSNHLEVWELDPTTSTWYDRTPCQLPEFWPLVLGPLGYDQSRRKVVLFSGQETWEWDGQVGTWQLRAPAFGLLPPNPEALLVNTFLEWDPQRRTLVLPGWDLFDWDGAAGTWTHRWTSPVGGGPPTRPVGSNRATFGYDPDRGVMLTFGGQVGFTYTRELWETDGVSWTNRTPAPLPAAWPTGRSDGRLFYEPASRKTILAAGLDNLSSSFDDLWAFDATTGAFTAAPSRPPSWSPQGYAFAATAGGGRVMVFQSESSELYLGHVLSWNVAAGPVTDLRPAHVPVAWPFTNRATAAYDARRGRTVMFGGDGDGTTNATSANLLEWNGEDGTWQDRTVSPNAQVAWPLSRRFHAMAADSRRGLILVFGGEQLVPDSSFLPGGVAFGPKHSDYWEWDGQAGTFTQRSPAATDADWPATSNSAAMTYDEPRDRVVLVGTGGGDPWEWNPAAGIWTRPPAAGTANIGSTGSLSYSPRDATTYNGGGPDGGAVGVSSWDPAARSWTRRVEGNITQGGPRWAEGARAVVDPISGLVWLASGATLWSWQAGASTWTDRTSATMTPLTGSGSALVFDARRRTLVVLFPGGGGFGVHVWELAVP